MMLNYQRELDKLIDGFIKENKVPTLLLHSCCAPCSSYVIEYLSQYFRITVLYYNPNIYPEEEYSFRKSEQQRLIAEMPTKYTVDLIDCDYNPQEYFELCKGHEKDVEGGARCRICFNMRLSKAAEYAKQGGFDYFATTLTVSPLKNATVINEVGTELAEKYGTNYLCSDFKKKNGYKRTIELSKVYSLYRQNYCGCVFSKRESAERDKKERDCNEQ